MTGSVIYLLRRHLRDFTDKIIEDPHLFSDFLESDADVEIVQTKKMGMILLEDISRCHNREEILAEPVEDGNALAKKLFNWETYNAFYSLSHGKFDPQNCDAETTKKVREMMQHRLQLLPAGYDKLIDDFFIR